MHFITSDRLPGSACAGWAGMMARVTEAQPLAHTDMVVPAQREGADPERAVESPRG